MVNTITLWLLISIGSNNAPHVTLERFNTQADCEAVRAVIDEKSWRSSRCVPAKVARTW